MSTTQGSKPREVAAERDFGFGVEAKEGEGKGVVAQVEEDGGRGRGNVRAGTRVVAVRFHTHMTAVGAANTLMTVAAARTRIRAPG